MSWPATKRRNPPKRWAKLRQGILERDRGICYVCGQGGADTVDHVVALADGGTYAETNLAAIHEQPCHRRKTAREAARHRWKDRTTRQPERHPGLR